MPKHPVTRLRPESDILSELNLRTELDRTQRRLSELQLRANENARTCVALLDQIQRLAAEAYQEASAAEPAGSRKLPEIAELAARAGLLCQGVVDPVPVAGSQGFSNGSAPAFTAGVEPQGPEPSAPPNSLRYLALSSLR